MGTHARGTAFIHVGTHKTGTTSIQSLLALNDDALRNAGILVPRAGRVDPGSAGHHNLAWELANDRKFEPQHGSLADVLREISDAGLPTVCLTSEDFSSLSLGRDGLQRLHDGLRDAGYLPRVIVYLRPQADYIESLYAELCRDWNIDFDAFLESLIANGSYGCSLLDYEQLVERFADVFGKERTIVRRYHSHAPSGLLLQDFAGIVVPGNFDCRQLTLPARLNQALSFSEVIAARNRHLSCTTHHKMPPDQPFDPLSLTDITRIVARFYLSNERLARSYGTRVGCVTSGTLIREVITEVMGDRDSRFRKRLIRALVDSDAIVAA